MSSRKVASERLAVQNSMKTLLANIRFASIDKPVCSLVVTSSIPNEGKTTIAIDLARSIASGGNRVLLVEADMRNRSIANQLGLRARHGLYAVLSQQVEIEDAVVSAKQPGMYFLDAEPHIPNPADILASKRFIQFIADLERRFDYVVFDTPPVGTFVDAAVIGAHADGVVFVIRENFTKRAEMEAAYAQLTKADVHVLGAVMNCCDMDASDYYYAYYNQEGKRVDRNAEPALPVSAQRPANGASSGSVLPSGASPSSTSQFVALANGEGAAGAGAQTQGVESVQQPYARRAGK